MELSLLPALELWEEIKIGEENMPNIHNIKLKTFLMKKYDPLMSTNGGMK